MIEEDEGNLIPLFSPSHRHISVLLLKERLHDALHELCPENANEVLSKIYDRLPTLSGCSTITIDKDTAGENTVVKRLRTSRNHLEDNIGKLESIAFQRDEGNFSLREKMDNLGKMIQETENDIAEVRSRSDTGSLASKQELASTAALWKMPNAHG